MLGSLMRGYESIAIAEAKCLGIPTFGMVDTNTDPFLVDYPIPANDDSIKAIKLITGHVAHSIYDSIDSKKIDITKEEMQEDKKVIESSEEKSKLNQEK